MHKVVKLFNMTFGLELRPEVRTLDLVSEVGELSKAVLKSTAYGKQDITKTANMKEELGDVYYALISLSHELDIDLDEALDECLAKMKSRIDKNNEPGNY
jgi:NTP pyrophosphatase (non-canonical NTP hydrolase)